MHKYWALYKAGLSRMSVYRGPLLIWSICGILSMTGIVAIWLATDSTGTIATYTKNQLITYAIMGTILGGLINWNPFTGVRENIKEGTLATHLLKPFSYLIFRITWELSWKTGAIIFNFSVFCLALLFLHDHFELAINLINPGMFIISALLAMALQFLVSFSMALVAFWVTEVTPLNSFRWLGMSILGGASIPIAFIPGPWQTIVKCLPFRYMYSFPVEILFNKLSDQEIIFGLIIQIMWLIVLFLIYRILWKSGLKSYISVGQ